MLNPYESPTGVEDSGNQSHWRFYAVAVSWLIVIGLWSMAIYGVYDLHSRDWPYPWALTCVLLATLSMLVLGGIGFAVLATGLRGRRRRPTFNGIALIVVATINFWLLFTLAQ